MKGLIVLVVVLTLVFSFSCQKSTEPTDPGSNETGMLKLGFDMSNAPQAVFSISGMLYRTNFDTIKFNLDMDGDSATAFVDKIVAGTWILEVNAYDEVSVLIYTGTAQVEIVHGESATVLIKLSPVTGSLQIVATWDDDLGESTLLAYYPFNGNANDESGNGIDGAVWGATLTTDRDGNANSAYLFDAYDDSICIWNGAAIQVPLPVTITAWILINGPGGIFTNNDPKGNAGVWIYIDNNLRVNVGFGDGSNRRDITSNTNQSLNTWYHVACVISGATDISLYVNNVPQIGTYSGTGENLIYNSSTGAIGKASSRFFSGKIDEVRFYEGSLTQSEIQALMQ